MIFKNTSKRFGLVSICLHWIMALIIIGMIILGLYMTDMPISVQKLTFYGWHKEFGILILMLIILRLTWRLSNVMPTLADLPSWEKNSARLVHWIFYLFLFLMPLTGWLLTSSAGLPVSFFGLFTLPNLVSVSEANRHVFTTMHQWIAYTLIGVICLHVGAALKHFFIDKDTILQRMIKP